MVVGDKLRRFKGAISSVLRYVDAVFSESHDVPDSINLCFLTCHFSDLKIPEYMSRWLRCQYPY